jgi:hypothetical protein
MSGRKRYVVRAVSVAILVLVAGGQADAQDLSRLRCGTGVHDSEATGTVAFPQDQIFCPLLADPKEPRSFVSWLRGTFRSLDDPSGEGTTIGSVGVGDSFGLVRWNGREAGDGVQLDLVGSIFAQFDLAAPSNDLINADYIIGIPLTFRTNGFSIRTKVYHQSSHLGDEYLLRGDIERENLSFESFEFVASQEISALRVYGGGERVFHREPETVATKIVHAGAEVRTPRSRVQFVAGVDVKASELHDWSPATSGRIGLQFMRTGGGDHPARLVTLMVEAYQGPSPYGQFFQDDISYLGVGLHFSL